MLFLHDIYYHLQKIFFKHALKRKKNPTTDLISLHVSYDRVPFYFFLFLFMSHPADLKTNEVSIRRDEYNGSISETAINNLYLFYRNHIIVDWLSTEVYFYFTFWELLLDCIRKCVCVIFRYICSIVKANKLRIFICHCRK